LFVAVSAGSAHAQTAPAVAGRVVDAFSMQPVAGATIEAGPTRTRTGADGRFSLDLPRGAARLKVIADGYFPEQVDVTIGDTTLQVEVLLLDQAQFREEVNVTAGPSPVVRPPSTIEVSPLEVRSVAGAAENVFRVLQTLPGVNATDDFGSRLAVRGGGPDQNLTIMDGVEIHDPYRLFGLTSAFNPETVENFELTAGGFSARYGDRLSSVLLIENRAGTKAEAFAGSFSLGLTDTNAVLEGRLPGGMRGSWLVTGRRTYYDLVAERFTESDLPSFADLQAKGVWEPRPGQRVTLFALRSRERTDASFDDSERDTQLGLRNTARNDLASLSFFTTLGTRASSKTIVSWYRYGDGLAADGTVRNESARANVPDDDGFARASIVFTRDLAVRDVSVRQEFALKGTGRHLLEAGFETHALSTGWGWRIDGDRNQGEANGTSIRGGAGLPSLLDSRLSSSRAGAWILDRYQVTPRILVEPGLRVDWSQTAGETLLSPRVSAQIDAGRGVRLRAAVGLFSQSPGYEKLLQSDYFVDLTSATPLSLKSERAAHVLAAVERDLGSGLLARAEAYYKSFDRLIVGRLEAPAEQAARVALYQFPDELAASVPASPQITSTPVNGSTGRAYGFDLYVARRQSSGSARLAGWASYTWGRAERDSYGRKTPFDYDRRHAFSLVGTYRAARWLELGASVRVASGFPYTPVRDLRVAAIAERDAFGRITRYVPQRDPSGLYVWTTDLGGVENLNRARLPRFARLDVRATFKPGWMGRRLHLYAEVINVLNRDNAGRLDPQLAYDPGGDRPRLTLERQGGVPLLPSIGIRYRF
jgi:hypothetical protein